MPRPLKVYVAGSSIDIDISEPLIARIRAAGLVVTHDWTAVVRAHGGGNPVDLTREQRVRLAEEDIRGAVNADWFWLVMPQTPTAGAWFEFGAAHEACVATIVPGPGQERSIFAALANETFATHEEAIAFLIEANKERGGPVDMVQKGTSGLSRGGA